MTTEPDHQEQRPEEGSPDEGSGISRGYFLFAGVLGAAFVVVAVVFGVIIGAERVIDYFQWSGEPGTSEPEAGGGGEAGGGSGDAANGEALFSATCTACHGPDGSGIPGLGPDLHNNTFIGGLGDEEVVAFLVVGRPADDPANTTGVAMPPKGGNPALSDDDLADITAYLRSLQ